MLKNEELAPWLNWIEQPPPKGQVAGSSPAGVASNLIVKSTFIILSLRAKIGL